MKLIISMPDALRSAGIVTYHAGASGASYRFDWNDGYAMHIYLGRELEIEEFNKVARDMFSARDSFFAIVPMAVAERKAQAPTEMPQLPPKRGRGRPRKEEQAVLSAVSQDFT